MRQTRRLLIVALVMGPTFASGCVRRRVEGDIATYSLDPWVILVTALVAVSALVAGWSLRRVRKWLGYVVFGGGVLVLCTAVPGLSVRRAKVAPDHVQWNRGFNRYYFRFDDLSRIEHTVKKIRIGPTIQDVHYLDFTTKSGQKTHIQVEPGSDRFLQDAIPEILKRAKERDVPCTEQWPN